MERIIRTIDGSEFPESEYVAAAAHEQSIFDANIPNVTLQVGDALRLLKAGANVQNEFYGTPAELLSQVVRTVIELQRHQASLLPPEPAVPPQSGDASLADLI